MQKFRLLDTWLSHFEADAVVWTDGERDLRAAELLEHLAAWRSEMSHWCGGRTVALAVHEPMELARLLVLLNGVARSLLLEPGGWADDTRAECHAAAGVECLVADKSPPGGVNVDWRPTGAVLSASTHGGCARTGELADTRVVIPTSGTTGTPKLVSHSWATLGRTVKAGGGSACHRWGLLYDLGRFAGLQVLLQALASRATLIFTNPQDDLDARLATLVSRRCDALSATPTLWRKILMSPSGRRLALRQVTLGGEIADDMVLGALARFFPEARLTHIYASTEAGVGFSVHDGLSGFPASYVTGERREVELKVDGGGRLWLRPAVRDQFFLGGGTLATADGWIDSGDVVELRGDRYHFLGRANGVINVGGDKVFPEEIERVILELPEVALARVSGRRNPIVGSLVEAAVVPCDPRAAARGLAEQVREHCRARLAPHEVPAVVSVVPRLDVQAGGKVTRSWSSEKRGSSALS